MIEQHEIEIRVRYCDTDAMGFLHHANYIQYFEVGRTELFRAQGGNYRKMEERGLFLVVASFTCRYHLPARYDDVLTLKTTLTKMSAAKLKHRYEVFRDDSLIATGESVLACVDRDGHIKKMHEVFSNWNGTPSPSI